MQHIHTTLILCLLLGCYGQIFAQPKLVVVGGNHYDWGTIYQTDTSLTAKIGIQNIGNKNLIIREIRPTCGCTTAPIEKSVLLPQEITYLNVSLSLGTNRFGKTNKPIIIVSNSVPVSTETISLTVNVIKPLQPSAQFIAFPPMIVGKRASASMSILNTTDTIIEITSVKAIKGVSTNCKAGQKIKPHASMTLSVEATPTQSQAGYFHSQVFLTTNHPLQNSLTMNIYGDVKTIENQAKK
jgi:hypothetical protein